MARKEYWLISTEHLSDRIWFQEEEDFVVAMNMVAVIALLVPVRVLCFVLMSNHVHFVLESSYEDAFEFICKFKQFYSRYVSKKYGQKKMLRRNDVDILQLGLKPESLERAIAYVLMNPVAANICTFPSQYPWGCGSVFFNQNHSTGKTIGSLSERGRYRIFHCNATLPPSYELTPEGFVSPLNYIPIRFVENLFQTPKRFSYFLMNSSKAKSRLEKDPLPSFRDQTILAAIPDLCRTLFRKDSFDNLSSEERPEFFQQLRRRFSADVAQLARITGLEYSTVSRYLDAPSV
ncbi:MAG: hypothetical protein J5632_00975 [Bacteroidales bacterium]|nr:hypothetical protein [Bacteroidales bacterium]